ncbi:unnamed protein product [Sphagnum troendelagicum]|uniref:Uncharacterized protein n=1 Tax=Sphagnum troendelagicum TaxID=128251 RepID=A0ABP0UU14_9BRYO
MQVHKRKASAQTYEKAKLKVSHAALENVEMLQTKVKFLTKLLQDSKGGRGTTTMTTEQRGCIQVVETSKETDVDEAKQRIEHPEQSLKAAIEIHKLEVEALRAESLAEATEKETQQRLQELRAKLLELWNLMDTPIEEQQLLQHITSHIAATQDEINIPGTLSSDTIAQAQMEVDRLDTLKASRMKELAVKRRLELEDICRCIVDPTQLLSQMEKQIMQAKQEALTRKEILEKMEKWMSACEEEGWLEDYNKDENRFASKGAHLNLKRAEHALAAINKLPGIFHMPLSVINNIKEKMFLEFWEGVPFMFDGVRLLSMLDEYNYLQQEKDEEKRRLRHHNLTDGSHWALP